MLETYTIKLKAIGPVCIGSGRVISKKETIYDKQKDVVYVMDVDKMFADLLKMRKEKAFEDFLLSKDGLAKWFRDVNIDKTQYSKWIAYTLWAGDAVTEDKTIKEIQTFVKDPYGQPYIPGSSLKGAIRTALLGAEAKRRIEADRNEGKYNNKYASIQKDIATNGINVKNARDYKDLDNSIDKLSVEIFNILKRTDEEQKPVKRENAVNDFMSGIIISDSKPLNCNDLVLCQKEDKKVDGTKSKIMLRECLKPGTVIEFDLTIDTNVSKASIGAINTCIKNFVKSYYDTFMYKFEKTNKFADNTIFVGAGTGYPTKTVMYQVLGRDGVRQVANVITAKAPRHGHNKDVRLGISPHTRKVTTYKGMEYDMGQCEIEFIKK